uniref:Uncharacterized protein n=1 Tax=Anguilla anguilla TaxID=7936 RepID=A0A0E9QPC9_ANGAN
MLWLELVFTLLPVQLGFKQYVKKLSTDNSGRAHNSHRHW